jgi:hypothetical protein
MNSTQPAGTPAYTINRAYIADSATVNATGVGTDQIVLNIGEVALHLSRQKAKEVSAELAIARLILDMKEDARRDLKREVQS